MSTRTASSDGPAQAAGRIMDRVTTFEALMFGGRVLLWMACGLLLVGIVSLCFGPYRSVPAPKGLQPPMAPAKANRLVLFSLAGVGCLGLRRFVCGPRAGAMLGDALDERAARVEADPAGTDEDLTARLACAIGRLSGDEMAALGARGRDALHGALDRCGAAETDADRALLYVLIRAAARSRDRGAIPVLQRLAAEGNCPRVRREAAGAGAIIEEMAR